MTLELFGGLNYANVEFISFVERLEYVFINTLTPEVLGMNGSCLINFVYFCLNEDAGVSDTVT